NRSWRDRIPGSAPKILQASPPPGPQQDSDQDDDDDANFAARAFGEALQPGSNNWVVSGAHTVTGKPLLSNDMHLRHQVPNVWYEAHLTAGDFDVAGVTLPGFPYVIAGHNRRVAWGFTNLGPA